ncbi:MAG: cupin domain-containing protein [Bacteroidales bacterium]|nr:cupin domain-containing protein [Bacteroidales bacterium]
MIIKPNDIETSILENFKGGDKHLEAKMFYDGTNRILTRAKLIQGASIGMHTHDDSCEVIFILEGCGSIVEEGIRKAVQAGDCLYCPKGGSHSLVNDSEADLIFCAVVPKQ